MELFSNLASKSVAATIKESQEKCLIDELKMSRELEK